MRNDLSNFSNTGVLSQSPPFPSWCPGGELAGCADLTELRDPLASWHIGLEILRIEVD